MLLAGAGLSCIAAIPRDDATQPLLPFYFALGSRRKVWAENLVPNICTLMRAFVIVIRQPFAVYMVELFQRDTDEVIKTLFFYDADTCFGVSVRLGRTWRSFYDFRARSSPQLIEATGEFCVSVANKMARRYPNVIQPHRGVSGLLQHPFFIGMKRGRTHEDPAASEVDKDQNIRVEFPFKRIDGLCEKVDRDERFNMRVDKL